ncbi:MAG: sodium-dependent transporter [Tenericutes bacterium]|nr:sodium-dependent transporter [Mycoplasmatota bacterium]MBI9009683.1 sodium-dependent transporter [Mycoplasmatota bacterium]
MSIQNSNRENWGSKLGFILAAAGSAIGLGNIWKFPYVVGENGGAAFIIIYLICTAVIGLPVIIAEILLGRTTQRNPVGAFYALSKSKFWASIGGMGVFAGFVILSFYSVVAGWSFGYIFEAINGVFNDFQTPQAAGQHFEALVSNVYWIVGFQFLFTLVSIFFVYRGVQKGIEQGSKIMMPVLFVLLFILMIRGLTLPNAEKGIEFLFNADWSLVNGQTVLMALGQAFFTLSLGMGAMMTYGSYMSKKNSIPTSAIQIIFLDTLIALVAGVAIFTAVFATGQDTNAGPGLIFHTLPVVFNKMPGGYIFSILFFILLTIAAITSAISLLEVITAYFVDERKWSRKKAAIVFGIVAFVFGVPSALSFNVLSDTTLFGLTYYGIVDYLASNILLPLGGFFIAVFVAWRWGFDKAIVNLKDGAGELFAKYPWMLLGWKILIKYLAPILIFLVFLNSIGLF